MALPRRTDTYEDYTEQLVYLSARLAANPLTRSLAQDVELILSDFDQTYIMLRDARRDEVRKRALRDHQHILNDDWVRKFQRRIYSIVNTGHFVRDRVFPKGVKHITAPRTWSKVERLRKLVQAIDTALQAPQLAADADAIELTSVLQAAKVTGQQMIDALKPKIESWDMQVQTVTKAQHAFDFLRTNGVERLGVTIGQLRALLDGNARKAYAYTQPKRGTKTASKPMDDAADKPASGTGDAGGDGLAIEV